VNQQENQPTPGSPYSEAILLPGAAAPDFRLRSAHDTFLGLKDFTGRSLILAFYPADWSAVCGDQMALYNEILPDFNELGADILGVSVDGVWCHAAFAKARNLKFPLLADFEPKGEIARRYGVYRAVDGTTERALFVINPSGVIHWSYLSPIQLNPGAAGILRALEELKTQKASQ
jgi:peroxiredoxin